MVKYYVIHISIYNKTKIIKKIYSLFSWIAFKIYLILKQILISINKGRNTVYTILNNRKIKNRKYQTRTLDIIDIDRQLIRSFWSHKIS